MERVIQQIQALETVKSLSKHEQIVQGVLNAINERELSKGEMLPSVNKMIAELGFARETIVKAYKELIHTGIVESKNRLGYFVTSENVQQELKVALVIYAFDIFQETFYEHFRKGLGEQVHLDVFFHHNNFRAFDTIVNNIRGKYGMYVIAPIPDTRTPKLLKKLPVNRVMLVDRHIKTKEDYNYVVQEFKQSSYDAFTALSEKMKRFEEVVFFFKSNSAEPQDILDSFKKVVKEQQLNVVYKESYTSGSLEKGKVYFTIHNLELWEMLKDTKAKGYALGKDVGFISHNDDIVKEIIFDGVTTFSTDFAKMGARAAKFVKEGRKIQEIIPTLLIERNSL